ncbi:MAG: S1 RNA-binding domain-containing protein [Planctomycetota bacterium]|nr:S1 RNA-binding domain-containing protein [Planctomycetota bacterium]
MTNSRGNPVLVKGDIVNCTVYEITDRFGVYAETASGVTVLIPLCEMSWDVREEPEEIVSIGGAVEVKIGGFNKEVAIGSIKEVRPELNPWHDPSQYKVGDVHVGTIINTVAKQLVFAYLPSGASVLIRNADPRAYNTGQQVKIRLIEVDLEYQALFAELCTEDHFS